MSKLHYTIIVFIFFVLTACSAIENAFPAASTPIKATASTELEHINVGVGFIPNVQFAPFYVAQAKGFYADEGLDVALEHGFENDFVTLTATGERQFAVASGDQVILARAQELPVVYVMKWYQRFPVGITALAETGIDAPEKLEGQSVGIPGLFGASYVAWRGLVYATGLDESTITLEEIGFTQAEAISQRQVDAAVIYIANEPVQLSHLGKKVNVIEVSDYLNLVSNGLVTNETVINQNPDLVKRMVRGTLRGLEYTIAHPDEAFEIARKFVPEITDDDAPTQRAVLDASIELWRNEQPGLSDPQAWAESAEFMVNTGLIEQPVEVDTLYTNEFVDQ
jgi:NitT/TauT family transport system substrate-binding protein